jgi:hypothetical protein
MVINRLNHRALVPRKGNQEYDTTGARFVLLNKTSFSPLWFGGNNRSTLPPRKCSAGSIMESKWSSKRVFPLRRNLRSQNLSTHRMSFCDQRPSRGPTHRDVSRPEVGRRAGSLQVKGSHSSDKDKQRIVHALCSLNESTVNRQTTYEDLRILRSVVRPKTSCSVWMWKVYFFMSPSTPSITSSSPAT